MRNDFLSFTITLCTKMVRFCALTFTLLIFYSNSAAFENVDKVKTQSQISDISILTIGSEYQNSIKILNNRFRIDSDIKEVTIVFFREFGSAPVVLVRPDGSKLYLENDLKDDSYNWFETDTYDMIALTNPMRGPWQAVGDIQAGSKIMVVAGINLMAEPIPDIIFSGETIKQTARLENIGSDVDISLFRDVVTLSIEFVSTNNPNFSNFGLGSRKIARFKDNGLALDEYRADGVFTGQFNLNITEGEWRPIFTVKTPLFSREQINNNIILHPSPVKISHALESSPDGDHFVYINMDEEFLQSDGFIIDGSIRYPNADVVDFSVTDASVMENKLTVLNNDYGIYKVNMTVFATTLDGREVVLSIPEYSFLTAAPEIIQEDVAATISQIEEVSVIEIEPVPESNSWLWLAIILNFIILSIGCLFIVLLASKRKYPDNHVGLRLKKRFVLFLSNKQKIDTTA
jgi:uncharacterized protein (TIGR03503 family)